MERLIKFVKSNKLITVLFVFSLSFFIYQHYSGFSWDFAVYSLNGRYMLHDGHFFEWSRPPLAPFLLGVFGFFGMIIAEYIYIAVVSILFLYSSIRLAENMKINRTAYYVFAMNAFTIIFSFQAGTELLSMALLQLFVAEMNSRKGGVFLGLSMLVRYSNIIYLPLLLFKKRIKDIVIAIAVILAMFSVWLIYNFALTGNALSSLTDFYLLNIKFRQSLVSFSLMDFVLVIVISLPFFVYTFHKRRIRGSDYLMLSVLLTTAIYFPFIAIKYPRFLFYAAMPAAYFLAKIIQKKKVLCSVAFINIVIVLVGIFLFPQAVLNEGTYHYRLAAGEKCRSISNAWIAINYYGGDAEPTISNIVGGKSIETDTNRSIEEGYRMILFKYASEPSYVRNITFLRQFHVLQENDVFIVLGKGCGEIHDKIDSTFFDAFNSELYKREGYRIRWMEAVFG